MHPEEVVLLVAAVLVGGVVAQWLGWRLRVPAIVFLLLGGLLAGPILGLLDPDEAFGELLFPSVQMAVAVILFEGAMGLGWQGVREAGATVWMLLTVGVAITLGGSTLAAHAILDIDWNLALLLGTVLVVTGPTVIGPILRSLGMHGRIAAILETEGTLIDPLGAILAVIAFQVTFGPAEGGGAIVRDIAQTLGVGTLTGVIAAAVLVVAFARYFVPDELHNFTTLAAVIGTFAVANEIREESGLVAVVVMGIVLASQRQVPVRHVLAFNETLRLLLISGLFVLLGARISADTLRDVEWQNIAFLAVLVVLVRPVSVWVSTLGRGLGRRQRIFLAATAPRGIVAAAIASIYSLRLAEVGVENSQILVSATFTVIVGTVLLSGLGSRPLASRLGLLTETREAIVLLGSNPLSRALAEALEHHDAPVRILDLDNRELAAARMTGLPTRRASVLSDETWNDAEMHRAASFVALTSNDELNMLATKQAAEILGRKRVFQLPPSRPEHEAWWTLPVGTFARPLFAKDANYRTLTQHIEDGWRISSTHLTDRFGPTEYADTYPGAVTLAAIDDKGTVDLISTDAPRKLRVGDTVMALTRGRSNGNTAGEP